MKTVATFSGYSVHFEKYGHDQAPGVFDRSLKPERGGSAHPFPVLPHPIAAYAEPQFALITIIISLDSMHGR